MIFSGKSKHFGEHFGEENYLFQASSDDFVSKSAIFEIHLFLKKVTGKKHQKTENQFRKSYRNVEKDKKASQQQQKSQI